MVRENRDKFKTQNKKKSGMRKTVQKTISKINYNYGWKKNI